MSPCVVLPFGYHSAVSHKRKVLDPPQAYPHPIRGLHGKKTPPASSSFLPSPLCKLSHRQHTQQNDRLPVGQATLPSEWNCRFLAQHAPPLPPQPIWAGLDNARQPLTAKDSAPNSGLSRIKPQRFRPSFWGRLMGVIQMHSVLHPLPARQQVRLHMQTSFGVQCRPLQLAPQERNRQPRL